MCGRSSDYDANATTPRRAQRRMLEMVEMKMMMLMMTTVRRGDDVDGMARGRWR
jgi:hypothetical protein